MAKKITVVFLMAWGNPAQSYKKNQTVSFSKTKALSLLEAKIVKIKNEEESKQLLEEAKAHQVKLLEQEAQAKAILESDRLKVELNSLYAQVVIKEAELLGVVLSDEVIVSEIETLMKRVDKKEE